VFFLERISNFGTVRLIYSVARISRVTVSPGPAEIPPMKPAPFTYHLPKTIDETVALLAELAPKDGRVLAGGQSLVPTMAFRLSRPAHLIDINQVEGLDRLHAGKTELVIGARVRHAAFHRPVVEGPLGTLLTFVVRHIAHYPIRVRGTFCGSLAHADPASEWCLAAATLGATMVARSSRGTREIPADRYFEGALMTALKEGELLAEARLPLLSAGTKAGFYEFSRRAGDYAIAMALATYRVEGGRIVDARIGTGGAESHPRRLPGAEAALNGKAPGAAAFKAAAEAAAAAVDPVEDAQATAHYRRDLVRTVTQRALERAAA
jgi:aerobic carbon-monoxide dehydrogenase medium subunit